MEEPPVWTREHQFMQNGVLVHRKVGEPVHHALMKSWRQARRARPELFQLDRCRVWGQQVGYMDEIICAWHSDLIFEESGQALLSQDLFAGELTETVLARKYCNQQVQHVIGPKVTGKIQLTDITFAATGKNAGELCKAEKRRAMRARARAEGTGNAYRSSEVDLMDVMLAMHDDCVHRAGAGAVVAGLRQAHWLAFEPGDNGLVIAHGRRWEDYPLFSHRLSQQYVSSRFAWVVNGVPQLCDWEKLEDVRRNAQKRANEAKSKRFFSM